MSSPSWFQFLTIAGALAAVNSVLIGGTIGLAVQAGTGTLAASASVGAIIGAAALAGHFARQRAIWHAARRQRGLLTAAMTGQILLAWLKLLALDGDLTRTRAEPRTLRPGAARRRPAGPRGTAAPPEDPGILAMGRGHHHRVAALRRAPASSLNRANHPSYPGRKPVEPPRHPARQPGHRHTQTLRSRRKRGPADVQRQPSNPMKDRS